MSCLSVQHACAVAEAARESGDQTAFPNDVSEFRSSTHEDALQEQREPLISNIVAGSPQLSIGRLGSRRVGATVLNIVSNLWHAVLDLIKLLPAVLATLFLPQPPVDYNHYFRSRYGDPQPHFFVGRFLEAQNKARQEKKILVVYLHSERDGSLGESTSARSLFRNVLQNETFLSLLAESAVVWAALPTDAEGSRLASRLLRCATYPHLAFLVPSAPRTLDLLGEFQVEEFFRSVGCVEGPTSDAVFAIQLIHRSVEILNDYHSGIDERTRQIEQDRRLREQQDLEYAASLQNDLEKESALERARLEEQRNLELEERTKREAEAKRLMEAEAAEAAAKIRLQDAVAAFKSDVIAAEANFDSFSKTLVTKVRVRSPNGVQIERKFAANTPFKRVFQWVDLIRELSAAEKSSENMIRRFNEEFGGTNPAVANLFLGELVTAHRSDSPPCFSFPLNFSLSTAFPIKTFSRPEANEPSCEMVTLEDVGLASGCILFVREKIQNESEPGPLSLIPRTDSSDSFASSSGVSD